MALHNHYKVQTIFLFFCLIFGSVFAVVNPPFVASDEMWHFFKGYDVSQGHLIRESPTINIPQSFDDIYHFTPWEASTVENFRSRDYSSFNKPLNKDDTEVVDNIGTYNYMPLPYLGVAFVIKVGELFNASPLVLMYFGRLINLLIYAIIVYFGIKLVPIGRYMFLLIGLMPMSLYLAASVSADSLNLALSLFTICLFLNLAFKEDRIHRKDVFLVSVCILGLTLSKQIYALLGLLFFIVPKDKFLNFKSRMIYFIYTILPSSLSLFLWYYGSVIGFVGVGAADSSSPLNSLNPVNPFFIRLMDTIILAFNGYISSFVGTFGWSTNPLPLSIVYLYLMVLVSVSILENRFIYSLKQRMISFFIFAIGLIVIFFVASNWKVSDVIWGVRGRYFIPLAPLFFLILQNQKVANYFYRKGYLKCLNLFIIIFLGVILIISTYYLWNIGLSTYLEYDY
jgi:uncharacterized membrane protein